MNTIEVDRLGKCYRVGKAKSGASVASFQRVLTALGLDKPFRAKSRELWALRDVSFAVGPGTVLGVIGPNGAGKTTLLKILARVIVPTEGRVNGRGRVVSLLEMGAGFQPELTARENIFMNAAFYGIPRSDVARKLDAIVEFAEFGEFLDSPLKHFSSGMYLRLAFSVAVNMEPDILLADEVLAVGDLSFQERCLERVREAGASGMTVLFVSHDMAAISRLCRRVLWLDSGRIRAEGDAGDIVPRYQGASWESLERRKGGAVGSGGVGVHGGILAVRLLSSEGQEIGAVRATEDSSVELRFEVHAPGAAVRCALDVYTRGIHAFRTVAPEFQLSVPGVWKARLRLPGNLLSETEYTLNASVTILLGGEEHPLVEYKVLTFKVYDTDEDRSARGTYRGKLQGVVTPKLDWEVLPDGA
jgi:lipopolysaccharide transport system ATP-binding protein